MPFELWEIVILDTQVNGGNLCNLLAPYQVTTP